jgi:SAM-dependent methyltransferase
MHVFIYVFALFAELVFLIAFFGFMSSLIYSHIKGSPYVPSQSKRAKKILESADLKKNGIFYELGSGDGRVSRFAAKHFGQKAYGIEVNPFLVWYSNLLTKIQNVKNVKFVKKNIFDVDYSNTDTLYIFLMPKLISELRPKLEKELQKGSTVISHGFKVEGWDKKLVKTLEGKPFFTYYYQI